MPKRQLLGALIAYAFAGSTFANPVGPAVVNGTANFATAGRTLTVTNTPNAIINWRAFSIGAGETTRFVQQSATSAVLNRVVGQDPSAILGTLSSNGRVFLLNPNGIVFGAGSRVDVAGLVASTLNLSNQDFLAGRLNFEAGATANSVVNYGSIATPAGGRVYLIAPSVENHGVISTPQGQTILAAGKSVQLVEADVPNLRVEVAAGGEALNVGQILAAGGAAGIYAGLINQKGTVRADSVSRDAAGNIVFRASGRTTLDTGSVTSANGVTGGRIEITGTEVGLIGNARVEAKGEKGGGTVLVGGDYQGKNPDVKNATVTFVSPDATINADATGAGDGGKVIVWSDDTTRAYGSISARGGAVSGNGGFVETSGKRYLDVTRAPDVSAPAGTGGTWLLDPETINIAAATSSNISGASPFSPAGAGIATLDVNVLNGALNAGGTVIIDTTGGGAGTGDINVNTAVSKSSGPTATLELKAHNDINISNPITSSGGALNMTFLANQDSVGGGVTNITSNLDPNGGTISIPSGTANWTAGTISNGGLSIASGATLDISGLSKTLSNVTVANAGLMTVSMLDNQALQLNNTTLLSNSGTLRYTNAGGVTNHLESSSGGGTLNNTGTFELTGAGTVNVRNNGATLSFSDNPGTVRAAAGNLDLQVTSSNSGVLELAGGTISVPSGFTNSSTGTIRGNSTLSVGGGGGTLTNNGTIAPGIPTGDRTGTLTMSGGLIQGVGGTVDIELEGTSPGLYDVVAVTGITGAVLGGTLRVNEINGFSTNTADPAYTVLTCSGVCTGTFATVIPSFGDAFSVSYPGNNVNFTVTSTTAANTWIGTTGLWQSGANWSLGHAPTSSEDASIPDVGVAGISDTVTVSAAGQTARRLFSAENLTISAGDLALGSVASDVSTINATLALSGGTLQGAGSITVNSGFTWSGGSMSGTGSTTVASAAGFDVTGTGAKFLDNRTLTSNSTAGTWSGSGLIILSNNAVWNNAGSWTLTNDANFRADSPNAPVGGTLNNSGLIRKMTATGTTMFNNNSGGLVFNNQAGGTLQVDSGTVLITNTNAFNQDGQVNVNGTGVLSLSVGGTGVGDYAIASGANVNLTGGTQTFNAGSITGAGYFNVQGGVLNVAAPTLSADNLTLSSGSITGGGALTVNSAFGWSGGSMSGTGSTTVASAAGFDVTGTGAKFLDNRTLTSNSTAGTWSGSGLIILSNNAVWNNAGSWTLTNDANFRADSPNAPVGGTLNNSGLIRKMTATGTTMFNNNSGGLVFNNQAGGTLQVDSGTVLITNTNAFNQDGQVNVNGTGVLSLSVGGTGVGDYAIASGANVNLTGGTQTFNAGSITGAGYFNVQGGVLNVAAPTLSADNLTLSSGSITGGGALTVNSAFGWSGGTMSGTGSTTVASAAGFDVTGTGAKFLDNRTLTSDSTAGTWSGSGVIVVSNNAVWNNAGSWTLTSDANFRADGPNNPIGGTLNNSGLIRKMTATGTTMFNNNSGQLVINNLGTGTLQVDSGTVLITNTNAFNQDGQVNVNGTGVLSLSVGGTGVGDYAIASGANVNLTGGTQTFNTGSSITGAGYFNVQGGVLNVAAPTLSADNLTLSSGSITGGGALTVNSAFGWSGGSMSGTGSTTVASAAGFDVTGTGAKFLDNRTLTSNSTAGTWSGSGLIILSNNAVWNNAGSWTLTNDANFRADSPNAPVGGTLNNSGLIRKMTATGTTMFNNNSGGLVFNNQAGGTLQVDSGTVLITNTNAFNQDGQVNVNGTGVLSLSVGGTGVGDYAIASGANVNLTGGTQTFNAGSITGAGYFNVQGGVLNVAAPTLSADNLTLSSGSITGGGALTVNSAFGWSGGSMSGTGSTTVASAAGFDVTGTGAKFLDNRTLTSDSTAGTWSGSGVIVVSNNAVWNNAGSWTLTSDANFRADGPNNPIGGTLNNSGLIRKMTATGTTMFNNNSGQLVINNLGTGTLQVDSGTVLITNTNAFNQDGQVNVNGTGVLSLSVGGTGVGDYAIASGANVNLTGGTQTFNTGSSITGAGYFNVQGGVLNVAAPTLSADNLTLSSGSITGGGALTVNSAFGWSGGSMSGTGSTTVASAAGFDVTGTGAKFLDNRTLTSNSTAGTWSGSGLIILSNNAVWNNAGSWTLTNDANFRADEPNNPIGGTLNNSGLIRKMTATGTTQFSNNSGQMVFNNLAAGTLQVDSGTVLITNVNGFNQDGIVDVGAGATLQVPGGFTNSATGVIRGFGTIDVGASSLTNDGAIRPGGTGTIGTLSIIGNYSQSSLGSLNVDLQSAVSYDVLAVSGSATLDGALNRSYLLGYTPVNGDMLNVLSYGSRSGIFSSGTDANALAPLYGATALTLLKTSGTDNLWVLSGGGTWDNPANWSLAHVPNSSEQALVGDLTGTSTIMLTSVAPTAGSIRFLGNDQLTVDTGGALTVAGTTRIDAGGTLSVGRGGIFTTNGAATVSNLVLFSNVISSGTVNGTGSLTVTNNFTGGFPGIVNIGGNLSITRPAGDLTVQAEFTAPQISLTAPAGSVTVNFTPLNAGAGGLTLTAGGPTGDVVIADAQVTSSGPISVSARDFKVQSTTYNTTLTGGSQNINATRDVIASGGTGGVYISTTGGTQTITAGRDIVLTGGTTGSFRDAVIQAIGGMQTITAGGTVSLAGGSGGDDNFAIIGATAGQTVTAPSIQLTGGGSSGPTGNWAEIIQSGPGSIQAITVTGGGTLSLAGGTGSNNKAHIESIGTAQTINFPSAGTLQLTAGSGGSGNDAAITAFSGTQTIQGSAGLTNAPTINVQGTGVGNEAVIQAFAGSQSLYATGVTLSGGSGVLSGSGTINLGGGTLINGGIVRPGGLGTVGTLSVTGNYSQGAGGSLDLDLQSGSSYDVLAVSGTAALAGTLNVNYLGGYTGAGGSHPVMTYASQTGAFGTVNDVNALALNYGATTFSLGSASVLDIWINPAGGDWSIGSNWSLGHEPGVAEDAQVPDLTGTPTISILSAGHTPRSFQFLGDETFLISGGSLSFTNPSSISNGTLHLFGGAVTANAGLTAKNFGISSNSLTGTGGLTVTSSYSSAGGSINLGGAVSITQAAGNLAINNPIAAGALTLAATVGDVVITDATVSSSGLTSVTGRDLTVLSSSAASQLQGGTMNVNVTRDVAVTASSAGKAFISSAGTQSIMAGSNITVTGGEGTNHSGEINQVGTGTQTVSAGGTITLMGGGSGNGSGNFAQILQWGSALQHITANAVQITGGGGATGTNNGAYFTTKIGDAASQQVDVVGPGGITLQGGTGSPGNNKAGIYVLADFNLPAQFTNATQVVNVSGGGGISLTGGDNATNSPSGSNNGASISAEAHGASGSQTVTVTGSGSIQLFGGASGISNNGQIQSIAPLQQVSVGVGGIFMYGGGGTSGTSNNGQIVEQFSTGVQTITVNGGGAISATGGTGTGGANTGQINNSGSGAQTITFTAPGSAITLLGGTGNINLGATAGNLARIIANPGNQTIEGDVLAHDPSITITGGPGGGNTNASATNLGNNAFIFAAGIQQISAGTVQVTGGATGSVDNSGSIQSPTQTINATSVTVDGGGVATGSFRGARIGAPTGVATNLSLTTSGAVAINGGNAPAGLGPGPSGGVAAAITVNAGGDVTVTGGASGARIGTTGAGGNVSVTSGNNIGFGSTGAGVGEIRTNGNVTLQAAGTITSTTTTPDINSAGAISLTAGSIGTSGQPIKLDLLAGSGPVTATVSSAGTGAYLKQQAGDLTTSRYTFTDSSSSVITTSLETANGKIVVDNPSSWNSNDLVVLTTAGTTKDIEFSSGTFTAGSLALNGTGNVTFPSSPTISFNTPVTTAMPAVIGGATVNFNGATTSSLTNLSLSSGILGGSGAVTVSNAFNWSGGAIVGTGLLTTAGTSTVSGSSNTIAKNWTNTGALGFGGGVGDNLGFNSGPAVALTNQGTIDLGSSGNATPITYYGGTVPQSLVNAPGGVINKGSAGTQNIHSNVAFSNAGTVNVSAGTLRFDTGGTDTGLYTVSSGAVLQFNGGARVLSAGSDVTGAGNLTVSNSTLDVNAGYGIAATGTTSVISSGTLNVNVPLNFANAFTLTGSTLGGTGAETLNGAFNWTNGAIVGTGLLTTAGTSTVSGSSNTIAKNWTNTGALGFGGGAGDNLGFNSGPAVALTNQGTIDLGSSGNATPITYYGGTVPQSLVNAPGGVINKGSAGTQNIHSNVAFSNAGTVNVSAGTLRFDTGGTDTGLYTVSSGAVLQFNGGARVLSAGSDVTGAGNLTVSNSTLDVNAGYGIAATGTTSVISSGTLNVNVPLNFANAFTLTGSTLGGTGAETLNGAFNWTNGAIVGTGLLTTAGTSTVSGSSNTIAKNWTNTGALGFGGGAGDNLGFNSGPAVALTNQGTIDLGSSGNATPITYYGGTVPQSLVNAPGGVINKGSAGTQNIHSNVAFSNAGTVNVSAGTLRFDTGGTDTGLYTVSSGAVLQFNGGARVLSAGSDVTGAGNLTVSNSTLDVNAGYGIAATGTTSVISSGTLNVNVPLNFANAFTLTGSTLGGTGAETLNGAFNWTNGAIVGTGLLTTAGTSTVSGSSNTIAKNWTNTGALGFGGGAGDNLGFNSGPAVALTNQGTIDLGSSGNATPITYYGGTVPQSLVNAPGGVINKGSAGTQNIHGNVAFSNAGTVNVSAGTLRFDTGGTDTGLYTVSSGAVLQFNGGARVLSAGSDVTGAGNLTVSNSTLDVNAGYGIAATGTTSVISSGTLNVNVPLNFANAFTLTGSTLGGTGAETLNGAFNWTNGAIVGTGLLTTAGTSTVSGSSNTIAKNWTNTGALGFGGGAGDNLGFNSGPAVALTNQGTIDLGSSGNATPITYYGGTVPQSLVNAPGGVINKGSAGTQNIHGNVAFSNAGTVNVSAGTLRVDALAANTNNGTIALAGGTFSTNGNPLINAGTIQGTGTVDVGVATLTNSGSVKPGGALTVGTLSINGNYSQGAGGSLDLDLQSGSSYDVLAVSGAAALDGTLNVNYLGGYTGAGSSHTVMTYASKTGTFATVNDVNALSVSYGVTPLSLGTLSGFDIWTNSAGGDWSVGSNWSLGHAPGAGEDAQVPNLAGTPTISILSGSQTPRSFQFLGDETFSISGGTLSFTNSSSISNGTLAVAGGAVTANASLALKNLTVSSGTLNGSGNVDVSNAMNWSGGSIGGTGTLTTAAASTSTLSGGTKVLTGIWQNNGIANWTGGHIDLSAAGAVLRNASGGQFNANITATGDDILGGSGLFLNQAGATFTVPGASPAGDITILSGFQNDGAVSIGSTNLDLHGAGVHAGTFTIASGAALRFRDPSANTFTAASSVSGAGTFQAFLGSPSVNVNGTFTPTTTLASSGTINLNAAGASTTTLNATGGALNVQGGTFSISGLSTVGAGGALALSGGNLVPAALDNGGQVNVNAGALSLPAGGTHTGAFSVNSGATLNFSGGTHNINPGATFAGAGTVGLTTGSLNLATPVSVGNFSMSGGTFSGAGILTVNGALNYTAGSINGTLDLAGSSNSFLNGVNVAGTGQIDNLGALTLQNVSIAPSLINDGALTVLAGVNTVASIDNNGLVLVNAGTLSTPAPYLQFGGLTLIQSGAALNVPAGMVLNGGYLMGNGVVTGNVNNVSGTLAAGASVGTLSLNGNYTQGPGGTMQVEMSGSSAGQYDVFNVTGTASIDGTLALVVLPGAIVVPGSPMGFLSAGSLSGTFATTLQPPLGSFSLAYTPTGIDLSGTLITTPPPVPPPPSQVLPQTQTQSNSLPASDQDSDPQSGTRSDSSTGSSGSTAPADDTSTRKKRVPTCG